MVSIALLAVEAPFRCDRVNSTICVGYEVGGEADISRFLLKA